MEESCETFNSWWQNEESESSDEIRLLSIFLISYTETFLQLSLFGFSGWIIILQIKAKCFSRISKLLKAIRSTSNWEGKSKNSSKFEINLIWSEEKNFNANEIFTLQRRYFPGSVIWSHSLVQLLSWLLIMWNYIN